MLDWLNSSLNLKLTRIEETASGAVACQIFDLLFPGVVQMSRVNWGAKSDWEFIANYKVLQAACDKVGVEKKIDVDRLIKAKHQDNLEFLQWLKKFFDDNYGNATNEYDAHGRRMLGKNLTGVKWAPPPGAVRSQSPAKMKPAVALKSSSPNNKASLKISPNKYSATSSSVSNNNNFHSSTSNRVTGSKVEKENNSKSSEQELISSLQNDIEQARKTIARIHAERMEI